MSAARQEGDGNNELDHSASSSEQIPVSHPPPMHRLWPLSLLPIGYRFQPSDEVLVGHYLRRKIDGHPSPLLILDFDVFGTEPWNLPVASEFTGDVEEERYFFCRIENEAKPGDSSVGRKRVVGASGYWKLTGTEKQILTLTLRAIKSSLFFSEGGGGGEDQEEEEEEEEEEEDDYEEGGGSSSTNVAQAQPKWIMHEFRPRYQGNQIERDQWAAYRVFQKRPERPAGGVIILRSSLQDLLNRSSAGPNSRSSS